MPRSASSCEERCEERCEADVAAYASSAPLPFSSASTDGHAGGVADAVAARNDVDDDADGDKSRLLLVLFGLDRREQQQHCKRRQ